MHANLQIVQIGSSQASHIIVSQEYCTSTVHRNQCLRNRHLIHHAFDN
jgi:hypothetical protein